MVAATRPMRLRPAVCARSTGPMLRTMDGCRSQPRRHGVLNMFARRLIVNDVGARVVPPAAALPVAPVATAVPAAPSVDLRGTLSAALAECAELAAADETARAALATAERDVATAKAALSKFDDLDVTIARHLASLTRAGTGGAGRTEVPTHLQQSRRAQHLCRQDWSDAEAVLVILAGEAMDAATALDRANVAAGNLIDALAALEAVRIVDRLRETERQAGQLRVLASAVGTGRRLGMAAAPWAVTSMQHDPWHGIVVELAGDGAALSAAATAAWQDYRTKLLTDPMAVFEAGPAV